MSRIRVMVDGRPEWRIFDDGATPLRHNRGIRGGIGNPIVGALVTGESQRDRDDRHRRESAARSKAHEDGRGGPKPERRDDLAGISRPVCGKTLRNIGEPCARTPGHGWNCKSAADLARRAAARRAEHPAQRPAVVVR